MTTGRPLAVRLYGRLLRLLQPALAREHGTEAEAVFAEQYQDVLHTRGRSAAFGLFVRSTFRLLGRDDNRRPAFAAGHRRWSLSIRQDVRVATRALRRQPGFALTAVLILAVGIGATTAIFSVVDTVILRELPYPSAGRLVHFDNGAHSYVNLRSWLQLDSFEAIAAARDDRVDLTGRGQPVRLSVSKVSPDFFRVFGGAPYLGRLFVGDDYPGDGTVAVLGYGAWQRLFGGRPDVVGQTVTLDGKPASVVGVLSPTFVTPSVETGDDVDLWMPLDDGGKDANDHGFHVLGIAGRRKPGATLERAQAEIDAERTAMAGKEPDYYVRRDGSIRLVPLVPLREATVGRVSTTLYLLLAAVGLMLLIACANVANLFMARGTDRAREIALRKALGAGRSRLFSAVLTESVVLSMAGGVAGLAVAFAGVEAFRHFNPGGVPRIDQLAVDARVLMAAMGISIAAGILFGAIPAWQASHASVADVLKDGARSATAGRGSRRTRSLLLVSEVALALVLCTSAGLLFRSMAAMTRVDPGFRTDGLTVLHLSLGAYAGDDRPHLTAALVDAIEAVPGTTRAAAAWTIPFTYTGSSRCCWRTAATGDPALTSGDDAVGLMIQPVTAGYFATLGTALLAGRDFTEADMTAGEPVAVVNVAAARELFGRLDVVGRVVTTRSLRFRIIGVEPGVHHWGLNEDTDTMAYVSYQTYGGGVPELSILIRSTLAEGVLAPLVRDAIARVAPTLPVGTVASMRDQVFRSMATPRFLAVLFGAFAGVALLLAAGGIYGSMLYSISQRRREMGIRLALGAEGGAIIRMVLRQGLQVTAVGLALGLIGAYAAASFLTSLVWGVEPTDPATLVAAAVVLAAAGLTACLVPAWRAARIDPLETLRAE